ncbi:MAG: hypothetical protein V1708_06415 [Candidatus Micrarchaeota archaeon]
MPNPFISNARRQWNSADVLERAFFAGEARKSFKSLRRIALSNIACSSFDSLDSLISLRLAEYFWSCNRVSY